jgi:enoyl-CoA hydratase/carnithine racemase
VSDDEQAVFNPFLLRLLLFPIPTIAAMNGHTFAGGWLLATTCDYRVMIGGKKRNAWACMNEVQFGAPWPRAFAALFRAKGTNPTILRRIALEGHRFTPSELLENGMVDALAGSSSEILAQATGIASKVGVNATSGVWGLIKVVSINSIILFR